MKKFRQPTFGGTRPSADDYAQVELPPPEVIDPADTGNRPMSCDPHADAALFNGNMPAALGHKLRPYRDPQGRAWITNAPRDVDASSDTLQSAMRGLVCGEPRPTTSKTEGSVERLRAAGIIGLYFPLESDGEELYRIATGGI